MTAPIRLSDYDFDLPEELIAQRPAPARDQSRLLVVDRARRSFHHDRFSNLQNHLPDPVLMVLNDTRVIPAKLRGRLSTTERPVELVLVREREPGVWEVMLKGLGRLKPGEELVFGRGELVGRYLGREGDRGRVRFTWNKKYAFSDLLDRLAQMPLPPYIHRNGGEDGLHRMDRERYQTVYAGREGAIAAPTAGLHFTPPMLENIRSLGSQIVFLTLHVGPGTFTPIRRENVAQHRMEAEWYRIPQTTWNLIGDEKKKGKNVLAVGTTTTRVLESLDFSDPVEGDVEGWTDRFLYPGQPIRTVDHLLTNFHLPRSTLFLLVCAFADRDLIRQAYREAIQNKYRFFSYGDAMLIL